MFDMRRGASVVLAVIVTFVAVRQIAAQEAGGPKHLTGGNEGKPPIGWQTRADASSEQHGDKHAEAKNDAHEDSRKSDTLAFAQMTPGFHITTGPGVILWHPDSLATGNFTIASSIFLFPTDGRDREGYGVFVGGRELAGAGQRYTYFLLRNDGRFLVKQRVGDKTTTLKDWTYLTAIKLVSPKKPKDAKQNDLTITAGAEMVTFSVNGVTAVTLPRAQVAPDGVFGLRVNHAVSLHVTKVARAG
jgi:hypothetical protein